jgi:hypothetical protein
MKFIIALALISLAFGAGEVKGAITGTIGTDTTKCTIGFTTTQGTAATDT